MVRAFQTLISAIVSQEILRGVRDNYFISMAYAKIAMMHNIPFIIETATSL